MRLLFAIKTMASGGGGAERILAQVTGQLAERGHEVILLSFDGPGSPDFYAINSRVSRIWLNRGRSQARTTISCAARRAFALRRELRGIVPDVAIGFMHSAYVPLAFAAAGTRVPVVGSEHCVYDHYLRRTADRAALLASASLYDRLTVVSEKARLGFPERLRRRMSVVPNPVVPNASSMRNASARRNVVLSVGRLSEEKNPRALILAFARIAERHTDWFLRIVGEGDLRPALEDDVRRLGLRDRVELPGATRDVDAEYSAAQLFASASSYESFGLATAEALSAGLPAIGFADCQGTNELIQDGRNGILADPTDRVAGLASALERLIASPEQRTKMSAAARTSVNQLSVEQAVDQWEELLAEVAKRRSWRAVRISIR